MGNTETKDGDSYAEGIGQTRVTENLKGVYVDKAYRIPDQTALTVIYQLMREEGLFLGLSSGINIAGAARFAKEYGPGQTIVSILCDSGHKYQSKIFNSEWLVTHGLDFKLPLRFDHRLIATIRISNGGTAYSRYKCRRIKQATPAIVAVS